MVKFYVLKMRKNVEVSEKECTKMIKEATMKNGAKSKRYMVVSSYEGHKLSKFMSEKDFNALNCKEA